MTGVRRVIPLTFGWEHIPKTLSVLGADPALRLRTPVPGVLCEVDGGWFLLDAGFNTAHVLDPPWRARMESPDYLIELPSAADSLVLAFETVGIDPADVLGVGLSHLHVDHCGGVRWFTDHAEIHCQRRELEFGLGDIAVTEPAAVYRSDFDDPRIDWRLADGDVEIAPGITAVATYGHTIGHQSFVVDLADGGGFVFAFDAADLQENLDDEKAPGHFVGTEEEAVEAIRRLKAIAAEKGYRTIPGHDPDVWPAFTAELGVDGPPELLRGDFEQ